VNHAHGASILKYHSGNIAGNDYASNNLLALAHDLDVVRALRLPIVALRLVVDPLLDRTVPLPERVVAITLDDGLDFDFIDYPSGTSRRRSRRATIGKPRAGEPRAGAPLSKLT